VRKDCEKDDCKGNVISIGDPYPVRCHTCGYDQ
jgi:hypothetical protein